MKYVLNWKCILIHNLLILDEHGSQVTHTGKFDSLFNKPTWNLLLKIPNIKIWDGSKYLLWQVHKMPMPTIEIKVSNVPNKNMRIQQVLLKSAPTIRLTKTEEKVDIIVFLRQWQVGWHRSWYHVDDESKFTQRFV